MSIKGYTIIREIITVKKDWAISYYYFIKQKVNNSPSY